MIEFLEKEHIYLVSGIIVPSVTQILKEIFPDKYKGINTRILQKKAEYGTKGHKIIEILGKEQTNEYDALKWVLGLYEQKEINQDMYISLREYIRLCKKHNIEVLGNEIMIHYGYEYAGTLDMIANVNGKRSLIDIKFTQELDKEYLSWQLGMYKLGYGEEFDNYYCLWLPKKNIGKLEPIKIKTKKEIIEMLKEIKL